MWLQLVTTLNQLKRPVKKSNCETMKMNNYWKQRVPEQERIRRIPRVERNKNMRSQDMPSTEIGVLSKILVFAHSFWKDEKTDHKITSRCSDSNSEFAVNGEKLALHEAETDMKKKTKRNSDIALHEINQEFKSQWLQLQQAKSIGLVRLILFGDLKTRKRLFRKHQAKDCQETEELRRTCCEGADRARQASISWVVFVCESIFD